MKLEYHARNDLYGNYAAGKIQEVLTSKNLTYSELELKFHKAGEKTSKFLLFIIIPFLALVSWSLGFKKRRLYYDHFIFSTELAGFFILWGYLIFPLIIYILTSLSIISPGLKDNTLGIWIMIIFFIYTFFATKRFFNYKFFYSLFYTVMISIMINVIIILIYKFILFYIGINLV